MRLPSDYRHLHKVLERRPEVRSDLWAHMQRRRQPLVDLLVERTDDPELSDLVLGVVMVAHKAAARGADEPDDLDQMSAATMAGLNTVATHLG